MALRESWDYGTGNHRVLSVKLTRDAPRTVPWARARWSMC